MRGRLPIAARVFGASASITIFDPTKYSTPVITRVGVILPCYNEEDWIEGAIESVLSQTYEEFVLCTVDDGSEDATAEVIDGFDDSRIRYVYQENSGHAGALNRGLEELDTEYYAMVDADDRWKPDKLERQIERFEATDATVVHSNATHVKVDGEVIGKHNETTPPNSDDREAFLRALFLDNFVCTPTVALHRSAIEDRRFSTDLYANADHDMWLRMAGEEHFEYIDDSLIRKRIHEGNISKNYERLFEDRKTVVERATARYETLGDLASRKLSEIYFTYAINLILDDRVREGRSALRSTLAHDPTNWKVYATYVLSYLSTEAIKSRAKAGKHYED